MGSPRTLAEQDQGYDIYVYEVVRLEVVFEPRRGVNVDSGDGEEGRKHVTVL